jgi:predicted transcriptional regulator
MTDRLIRLPKEWADAIRAQIAELELPHLGVDGLAGLPQGYCNKILNGKKDPTTETLGKLLDALALGAVLKIDPEREAIMRDAWEKARRRRK